MASDEDKPMNWVERRYRRESMLNTQSADLWGQVRSAIQDACASYQEHYGPVECNLENGKRLSVTRTIPMSPMTRQQERRVQVLVVFEEKLPPSISVAYESRKDTYGMAAEDDGVFLFAGEQRLSPDEVSERVLSPVLFPDMPKINPRASGSRRPPTTGGWMSS